MVECHARNGVVPMRRSHLVTLALNVFGDADAEFRRVAAATLRIQICSQKLAQKKRPDVESGEETLQ